MRVTHNTDKLWLSLNVSVNPCNELKNKERGFMDYLKELVDDVFHTLRPSKSHQKSLAQLISSAGI